MPLKPDAVEKLREFAEAWITQNTYPEEWLSQYNLQGRSYQTWFNTLTGLDWQTIEGDFCDLISASPEVQALTWLFFAEAIESGDF